MTSLLHAKYTQDVQCVLAAARLLNVHEYRLFELALSRQLGRHADAGDVAPAFMRYLKERAVPAWVRRYSVDVVECARYGAFDPKAYGGEALSAARQRPAPLELAATLLFSATALVCWLISRIGPA